MDTPLPKSEFWMRVAGVAFGLWALMIPIGVTVLGNKLSEFAAANKEMTTAFSDYRLASERRITLLEERQQHVLSVIADHDKRLDQIERVRPAR